MNLPIKERAEKEFLIRNLLEMRFGDGTGTDLQVKLATKEILQQIELAYKQGQIDLVEKCISKIKLGEGKEMKNYEKILTLFQKMR